MLFWRWTHFRRLILSSVTRIPYLAICRALAVSSAAADAAARVPRAWRLPGAFSRGAVVVEMSAAQVFVGLPVTQDV